MTISHNTVTWLGIALWPVADSNTVIANRVSGGDVGIVISGKENDVERNSFFNLVYYGINFNCTGTANKVIHNTINESLWGIVSDHGGNVLSPNSFSNVAQLISPPC